MGRGAKFTGTVAMLAVAACGGGQGKLQIRPTPTPLAAGARPVPLRIAEAAGQLALGNVALALEGFRKASREDPNSIEAFAGMAECYDRMGRHDLSRRNYEVALALAPGNVELLAAFAASLDLQGHRDEAQEVRQEIAARSASAAKPELPQVAAVAPAQVATVEPAPPVQTPPAAEPVQTPDPGPSMSAGAPVRVAAAPIETPTSSPAPEPQAPAPAVGRSVTVKLPPARPAPEPAPVKAQVATAPTAVAAHKPVQPAVPSEHGPRLERLSMGEIALITATGPLWRSAKVAQSARSTKVRFVPLHQASAQPIRVRLLNAARVHRLAARTRAHLAGRGLRGIMIGDAPATRSRSLILYPSNKRDFARKLSAHFGFAMAPRASGAHVTVLLGRDAARLSVLRPARA